MFRPGQLFDIASVGRRLGSALSHSGSLASISSLAGDTLDDDTWLPALIAVGVGAVAVGTGVGLVPGVGALGVVALRRLLRSSNNPDEEKLELKVEPEVKSIPMALAYELNKAATKELQDALVNLMDEPDWAKVKHQLQEEAEAWCREQIKDGKVGQLDPGEMREVLLSLISNVREAAYRELFAEHYRKIISVDRRDRVEDVFIRLKADVQRDARGEIDEPEDLDFHGDTPIEIEVTLRRSNNLVILGEPGSGKSALLRHLAASCAESESANPLLPVFLPLTKYTGDQENIIADRAVAFAQTELQIHLPDHFFEDALGGGRCLVCLDALDEVPEGERQSIAGRVEAFVARSNRNNPNNRFIVTSRLAGYDEKYFDGKTFTRYVAEPMDDDGIAAFIKWRFAGDPRAQNLLDVLEANPNIKALVSNPLLLTILNLVHQNAVAGLPLNRAGFYQQAVEILVADRDDEGKSIEPDEERQAIHKALLTATALHLHEKNAEIIPRGELEQQAAVFFLEYEGKPVPPRTRKDRNDASRIAKSFIERAEQRNGLLVERTPGSGDFGFVHTTFREYLTAEEIKDRHSLYDWDREECWEEIKDHLTDPRWREVILLLLGSLDERYCTYLTEKILAAGDETDSFLQLVAEALANQAPMSSELQQEIVGRLEAHGKGRASWYRLSAVNALSAIKHLPQMIVPALTSIATDLAVYSEIRVSAAEMLGRLGEGDTAIAILSAIATDQAVDAVTRVSAAEILGRLGERDKEIAILTAMAKDLTRDGRNHMSAVGRLLRLGEDGIAALTSIIHDPEVSGRVRLRVTGRLAGWGDGGMAEPANIVTNAAVDSGRMVVAEKGFGEDGIAALTSIVRDPEVPYRDRFDAAERLGHLGEDGIAALTNIVTNPAVDQNSLVIAAKGLGDLGEDGIAALAAIITDPAVHTDGCVFASMAIGELGKYGEFALIAIITAPTVHPYSRAGAARGLAELGKKTTAIALLTNIVTDSTVDPDGRGYAGFHLGQLGEEEVAIALLTDIATDPRTLARTRVSVAQLPWLLGGKEVSVKILRTLADDWTIPDTDRMRASEVLRVLDEE